MSAALTFLIRRATDDVDLPATSQFGRPVRPRFPSYFAIFGVFPGRAPAIRQRFCFAPLIDAQAFCPR